MDVRAWKDLRQQARWREPELEAANAGIWWLGQEYWKLANRAARNAADWTWNTWVMQFQSRRTLTCAVSSEARVECCGKIATVSCDKHTLVPTRTRPKFCNHSFCFGLGNLNSVQEVGGATPQLVTLQGAMFVVVWRNHTGETQRPCAREWCECFSCSTVWCVFPNWQWSSVRHEHNDALLLTLADTDLYFSSDMKSCTRWLQWRDAWLKWHEKCCIDQSSSHVSGAVHCGASSGETRTHLPWLDLKERKPQKRVLTVMWRNPRVCASLQPGCFQHACSWLRLEVRSAHCTPDAVTSSRIGKRRAGGWVGRLHTQIVVSSVLAREFRELHPIYLFASIWFWIADRTLTESGLKAAILCSRKVAVSLIPSFFILSVSLSLTPCHPLYHSLLFTSSTHPLSLSFCSRCCISLSLLSSPSAFLFLQSSLMLSFSTAELTRMFFTLSPLHSSSSAHLLVSASTSPTTDALQRRCEIRPFAPHSTTCELLSQVIALGFVMCDRPEQLPSIVKLLTESYNPHVRQVMSDLLLLCVVRFRIFWIVGPWLLRGLSCVRQWSPSSAFQSLSVCCRLWLSVPIVECGLSVACVMIHCKGGGTESPLRWDGEIANWVAIQDMVHVTMSVLAPSSHFAPMLDYFELSSIASLGIVWWTVISVKKRIRGWGWNGFASSAFRHVVFFVTVLDWFCVEGCWCVCITAPGDIVHSIFFPISVTEPEIISGWRFWWGEVLALSDVRCWFRSMHTRNHWRSSTQAYCDERKQCTFNHACDGSRVCFMAALHLCECRNTSCWPYPCNFRVGAWVSQLCFGLLVASASVLADWFWHDDMKIPTSPYKKTVAAISWPHITTSHTKLVLNLKSFMLTEPRVPAPHTRASGMQPGTVAKHAERITNFAHSKKNSHTQTSFSPTWDRTCAPTQQSCLRASQGSLHIRMVLVERVDEKCLRFENFGFDWFVDLSLLRLVLHHSGSIVPTFCSQTCVTGAFRSYLLKSTLKPADDSSKTGSRFQASLEGLLCMTAWFSSF